MEPCPLDNRLASLSQQPSLEVAGHSSIPQSYPLAHPLLTWPRGRGDPVFADPKKDFSIHSRSYFAPVPKSDLPDWVQCCSKNSCSNFLCLASYNLSVSLQLKHFSSHC
jgi:hypothetical protein